MKKSLLVLATVAATLAPLAVLADSTSVTTTIGATNGTTHATTKTSETANQAGTASILSDTSGYSDVMGTLSISSGYAAPDFSGIRSFAHYHFVLLSKLKGYPHGGMKLNRISQRNMTALDAKVGVNVRLVAALQRAGYTPSEVAGVSTGANGDVTVFIAK